METLNRTNRWLALPLRGLIRVYQRTISPDHSAMKVFYPYGYCKFYPSCSVYADEVLKHSGLTGIPKIVIRIIKCRPGTTGGVDLPHTHGKHI